MANFLIVEDSGTVRKVLIRALQCSGAAEGEFLEADNGALGLEILKEVEVDLVFLDINMPIMNGIEFMRHVSSDAELRRTPVVVISTEGSAERTQELKDLGIRAYLRKPFTMDGVAKVLHEILGVAK